MPRPTFAAQSFAGDKLAEFVEEAVKQSEINDVYFEPNLQTSVAAAGKRGSEDGVAALPGLFLDIDINGPGHEAENLFPESNAVLEFVKSFKLPPTITVSTAGGMSLLLAL